MLLAHPLSSRTQSATDSLIHTCCLCFFEKFAPLCQSSVVNNGPDRCGQDTLKEPVDGLRECFDGPQRSRRHSRCRFVNDSVNGDDMPFEVHFNTIRIGMGAIFVKKWHCHYEVVDLLPVDVLRGVEVV